MKTTSLKRVNRIIFFILISCSSVLIAMSLYNRIERIKVINPIDRFQETLVRFIIPEASFISFKDLCIKKTSYINEETKEDEGDKEIDNYTDKDNKEDKDTEEELEINEKNKIIERHITGKGIHYENFYIDNKNNIKLDVSKYLNYKSDLKFENNELPKVLIVHTHTSESFMKEDKKYYSNKFYPRSQNEEENVIRVGNSIENRLKENKIGVIHSKVYHDSPSYNGSYLRSAITIKENIKKYPSIQIVLDIHRDSIGNDEIGKIKPIFNINGRKAAQIMIITGCDINKTLNFPDWEYNLSLGLKLQRKVESMYPGMTRPMYFGNVKYNMNLTHGSLLIEVGTDANSIEEVSYTGELLGNALSSLIKEL